MEEIEEMDALDSEDLFCLITGSGFHLGTGKSIGLLGRDRDGLLTLGDLGHADDDDDEEGDTSLGLPPTCVGERIPCLGLRCGGDIMSVLTELVGERMSGIGTLGDKASEDFEREGEGLGGQVILSGCGKEDATGTGGLLALKAGMGDGEGERDEEGDPN